MNQVQQTNAGLKDIFVSKIGETGQALLYSTYIGGSGYDIGWAIDVNEEGVAFITGETNSGDYLVKPFEKWGSGSWETIIQKPYDYSLNGAKDAIVAAVRANGGELFTRHILVV